MEVEKLEKDLSKLNREMEALIETFILNTGKVPRLDVEAYKGLNHTQFFIRATVEVSG